MAGNEELFAAFDRLVSGVQTYSAGKALDDAQKKIQDLNSQQLDEFAKRDAQQQIAQQAGARIGSITGNASQGALAMQGLAPQAIDLQEQQLRATKQPTIAAATEVIKNKAIAEKTQAEERALANQIKLEKVKGQLDIDKQRVANEGKAAKGLKPLPKAVDNQLTTLDTQTAAAQALIDQLEANPDLGAGIGPVGSFRPDLTMTPEAVAYRTSVKQQFDAYRRIVTGAAASVPELKSLKFSTVSDSDTVENLKAKANQLIQSGKLVQKTLIQRAQKRGHDITGFEEFLTEDKSAKDIQGTPDGAAPPTAANPLGKYIKITK